MKVSQSDIEGIQKAYRTSFLTEKKDASKHGTKPGAGDKELDVESRKKAEDKKEQSVLGNEDSSGPTNVDNFHSPIEVGTSATIQPEKVEGEIKKDRVRDLNINMKSKFDTLYEDVMDDEAALGIDTDDVGSDDGGGFDDFGGEATDEEVVSLELPKDLADALYDALATVCGDDEEVDDGEVAGDDNLGGDDQFGANLGGSGNFDEMEERRVAREGVESTAAPDGVAKHTSTAAGSNVAAHRELVDSGNADSSVTDKVGNDGDLGTPVKGMKKGQDLTTRKKYKVEARIKNSPGDHAFSGK